MEATADPVLEDLGPEALVLPPPKDPEAQDLLVAIEIDPHGHKQGDLLSQTLPPSVCSLAQ